MRNYLDFEIRNIKNEILNLKTAMQKSAAVVPTAVQSAEVSLDLQLDGSGNPKNMAQFKIETNSRALVFATLNQYYDDIALNDHRWSPDTRRARVYVWKYSQLIYYVDIIFIGDGNDYNVVSGGGTATMARTLTVRCTDNFTFTRVY